MNKISRIVGCVLLAVSMSAYALETQLVVVTSFPNDLTKPFKSAFESNNPGIEIEMLKKKTTAGIKYIQETADNK
uniref:Sugar ABC transporter substrate-binding protein n=1 Tax=Candidatus Kentrum sp. LPFa TaxID=2126335 RepID=A0A450W714_9GAMM|nr:MAG: hypothetical protein BECKLPF1236B_GA0070989_104011 [Candidatus Kentron sp. LPFa]